MLVKNWMSRSVVTIDPDAFIQDAVDLLEEHKIHMLPVTEKGKLIGIVTERDFIRASVFGTSIRKNKDLDKDYKLKIREIMTPNPITIPIDYTMDETAEKLLSFKILGAPVVDPDGKMIGTITQTDIFRALILFTGSVKKGIQFSLDVVNRSGCIRDVTELVRTHGGRISSIITSRERSAEGYIRLYVKAYDFDTQGLARFKEVLKKRVGLLYLMDYTNNVREIY